MAQYEHLPIYKKAMDLTIYIENIVRGFSKYHKYTLGTDLRNLSRNVVRLIIRANSERDRLATLSTLRDTIEELKEKTALCGFPVRLEQGKLLDKKILIVIIKETDRYIGRIKERLPFMKMMEKEE